MSGDPRDPRSTAEKARADLKRNAEMDMSLTQTPLEREPSVTPDTFGVHEETARLRSGSTEGVEAGGEVPQRAPRESGRASRPSRSRSAAIRPPRRVAPKRTSSPAPRNERTPPAKRA